MHLQIIEVLLGMQLLLQGSCCRVPTAQLGHSSSVSRQRSLWICRLRRKLLCAPPTLQSGKSDQQSRKWQFIPLQRSGRPATASTI